MHPVPQVRIDRANQSRINPKGEFVIYWMIAARRTHWNFGLQRALEYAKDLNKPLVILEALRCGYPWASDRLHRFVIDGMIENGSQCTRHGVFYYPYLEPAPGMGKGLLSALSEKACVVITDNFPAFFIPRMVTSASGKLPVLLEQVDSNGLLPMRVAKRVFPTAYAFRRFLQKTLSTHLADVPVANPLEGVSLPRLDELPKAILKRWRTASLQLLKASSEALALLPIDHRVGAVAVRGGAGEGRRVLRDFVENRLSQYPEIRNHPDHEGTSGLSAYLHFGHISAQEVFHCITTKERWSAQRVSKKATGGRTGWWGMSEAAEAFLDQLITWRELGFNMCSQQKDYDSYEALPEWALKTLADHEKDRRAYTYSLEEFEGARTHDPLWNAAQAQLIREGRIHNYLRMLWGKKILEWTETPRDALRIMIELNNKYALDGRDPNSYSGIFWVLGRYDRAWGPERAVFGKVRYMSSANTAKKVKVKDYIKKYAL